MSRAFADWQRADEENRAFLRLSAKWSSTGYDQEWRTAEEAFSTAFDPDRHYGDEHVDLFEESVDGLWPDNYQWMTEAAVLKNGVTAYEVYLEKALREIIDRYRVTIGSREGRLGLRVPKKFESPAWPLLVKAYAQLDLEVDPADIRWARALRHLLTHQNGELRTDEAAAKFRAEEDTASIAKRGYAGDRVLLGSSRVLRILDGMGALIRTADPIVLGYVWGSMPAEQLLEKLFEAECLVFVPERAADSSC